MQLFQAQPVKFQIKPTDITLIHASSELFNLLPCTKEHTTAHPFQQVVVLTPNSLNIL